MGAPTPTARLPERLLEPAAWSCPQVVDKWFKCNDEESFAFARMLIAQEGLLCGEWGRVAGPGCRGRGALAFRRLPGRTVKAPRPGAAWRLPRWLLSNANPEEVSRPGLRSAVTPRRQGSALHRVARVWAKFRGPGALQLHALSLCLTAGA